MRFLRSLFLFGQEAEPLDLAELELSTTRLLSLTVALGGAIAWVMMLPGKGFVWPRFGIFLGLSALGVSAYWLAERNIRLAIAVLHLGSAGLLAAALRLLSSPATPFWGTMAVILLSAIRPTYALSAAFLLSVPLTLFAGPQAIRTASLIFLWLSVGLALISSRPTRQPPPAAKRSRPRPQPSAL